MQHTDLIFHIDCNSFYASCQTSFDPSLRGKAIVVLSNNDGNVIARNALAKALGVKMGQPYFQVRHFVKKGQLRQFSSNYELYGEMSSRVMNTLRDFSDQVEVYSIDEAFVYVRGRSGAECLRLARTMKEVIYRRTRIPVSIGIGPTRTVAKLANKHVKKTPDLEGVCLLAGWPAIAVLLKELPVDDLWGIGRQYAQMLNAAGILTAYQLTQCPDEWLKNNLTVLGLRMIHELRGERRTKFSEFPRHHQSVMVAPSFGRAITDLTLIEEALASHVARATEKLRRWNLRAGLVTVFLHTNRWRLNEPQHHASQAVGLPYSSNSVTEIANYAIGVLRILYQQSYGYRKVGVLLSGLTPDTENQSRLFVGQPSVRIRKASWVVDQINLKHGKDTVRFASQGYRSDWHSRAEWRSRCYTTRVADLVEVA